MSRFTLSFTMALLLGAAAVRSGSAQLPPPPSPAPVCGAPATDPTVPPKPEPAIQGWLILHGQLVPGPYTVTVTNDTVAVNGYLFSQPAASSTASLDTGSHAAQFQQFWSLWRSWCSSMDLASATQQAVAWWQAAPGVMSAALVAPGSADLQVRFTDSVDPEIHSLQIPDDPQPVDQVRAQTLSELAQEVDEGLSFGRLLIVEDEGRIFAAAAGESADLVAQIEQISALPTANDRYQALRAILPDERMATSIAQNFGASPNPTTQEVSHAPY
ncbi:MAG: hypothetical protein ACJ76N_06280 [Thermoanaerobaculia bacterium]